MTMQRADVLTTELLSCGSCILSKKGNLCDPAVKAIVKAAVGYNPTVDVPSVDQERTQTATNLLESMIYKDIAHAAGEKACRGQIALYNQTVAESPLTVMI